MQTIWILSALAIFIGSIVAWSKGKISEVGFLITILALMAIGITLSLVFSWPQPLVP